MKEGILVSPEDKGSFEVDSVSLPLGLVAIRIYCPLNPLEKESRSRQRGREGRTWYILATDY